MGLRSAMAESSRGKLVRLKTASLTHTHIHTHPGHASLQVCVQACVHLRGLPVYFVYICISTVYIYVYVCGVCKCVLSLVCGDSGTSGVLVVRVTG